MEAVALSVSKLNNSNWNVWKFQLRVVLMSKGLFEITCGSEIAPENDEEKLTKWRLKDAKAQEVLVTRMEEDALSYVMQCSTAKEMWSKLESIYERKSEVSTHLLNEQFYNLKIQNENIRSFISKVANLQAKLKQQGEELPEKMVMTKIIMSLPEKFRHFRSAWESVNPDSQNINNLTARLLIEEERLGKEEEQVALVTIQKSKQGRFNKSSSSSYSQQKKCFNCGKMGHLKFECRNIECNYCKKRGHYMKDCFIKKRREESDRRSSSSNNFALIAISDAQAQINVDWYMDSGASQHMCRQKELFCSFRELDDEKYIKIGNGSTLKTVGIGNICILSYNGQDFHTVTLFDVLFVPELKINLFSQGKALDKGLPLKSSAEKVQFISENGFTVATAVRSDKLFKMIFQVQENTCGHIRNRVVNKNEYENCLVTKESKNIMWWHRALAHQNVRYIKTILQQYNIDCHQDENFCTFCIQGKQCREPFKVSSAKKVGELIDIDLCGPMEVESLNNSRYMFLLKDDCSGYRFTYFLRNKSDVYERLKEFLAYFKTQTGKSIKVIRSDNGTEFENLAVKNLFKQYGIKHEYTVAYTPQQNGRAEREFRTIMEAVRSMLAGASLPKTFWAEAANTAIYLINRTSPSPVKNKTPYELLYGKQFDIQSVRGIFGTKVWAYVTKEKRKKLDKKSKEGMFVGYCDNIKGYRVYYEEENKVAIEREIIFTPENVEEKYKHLDLKSVNSAEENSTNEEVEEHDEEENNLSKGTEKGKLDVRGIYDQKKC